MRQLKEKEAALRQQIETLETEAGFSKKKKKRSLSSSRSESDRGGIRITNIRMLTLHASFRQRDEWLENLERAFNEKPMKFKSAEDDVPVLSSSPYWNETNEEEVPYFSTTGMKK